MVLVVVDIGFAGGGGGLVGGCGSGTVGGGTVVNGVIIGMTEDAVGTREVAGGKRLVTGTLDCGPEGGNEVMRLGGEGRDAGLAVY